MYSYMSQFFGGTLDPAWPHAVLIAGTIVGGALVGLGVILEAPKILSVPVAAVFIGIVIEAACTILLFGFDEGISSAQQSTILVQNGQIIDLEKELAPRSLSNEQIDRIGEKLTKFAGRRVDVIIDSRGASADTVPIAGSITFAFSKAKLWMKAFEIGSGFWSRPGIHIQFQVGPPAQFTAPFGSAIVEALKGEGLDASLSSPIDPKDGPPGQITVGARSGWVDSDVAPVRVTVATNATRHTPSGLMIIYDKTPQPPPKP